LNRWGSVVSPSSNSFVYHFFGDAASYAGSSFAASEVPSPQNRHIHVAFRLLV
jgi:hypothetical protein